MFHAGVVGQNRKIRKWEALWMNPKMLIHVSILSTLRLLGWGGSVQCDLSSSFPIWNQLWIHCVCMMVQHTCVTHSYTPSEGGSQSPWPLCWTITLPVDQFSSDAIRSVVEVRSTWGWGGELLQRSWLQDGVGVIKLHIMLRTGWREKINWLSISAIWRDPFILGRDE